MGNVLVKGEKLQEYLNDPQKLKELAEAMRKEADNIEGLSSQVKTFQAGGEGPDVNGVCVGIGCVLAGMF